MQTGAVSLPGRGLPIVFDTGPALPAEGGANGPAALPARIDTDFRPSPPAVRGGAYGPIGRSGAQTRRGPNVEDAAAPGLQYRNTLGHDAIAWSRPRYANVLGQRMFLAVEQLMSWTANRVTRGGAPASPIPFSIKRIDSMTVREQFGSSRQFFPWPRLDDIIQAPVPATVRRWSKHAKAVAPYQPRLTIWGPANSYGQATLVLNTQPLNTTIPGNPYAEVSQYGAY